MTYDEAVAAISDHINLEATMSAVRTAPPTLERMIELVGLLAEPQSTYPVIHLTGTNGKTSTGRMVTQLLIEHGLTVGNYSSPHLVRINERMTRNHESISDGAFARVAGQVLALEPLLAEKPHFFDILTAMAFLWFADLPVHAAVVEVGLFGRWDSTNVVDAEVAVLTNVGTDHMQMAGSRERIAWEKVGIVKPDSIFVLGETDPSLAGIFAESGAAETWRRDDDFACVENLPAVGGRLLDLRTPGASYDGIYLPVLGYYQGDNAACALAAAEAFFGEPLPEEEVAEAFASVRTPGRMEVVSRHPLVVLDGAHNAEGIDAAARALAEEFGDREKRVLVFGALTPHEPGPMLEGLDPERVRLVVACEPDSPRAVPAVDVIAAARALGLEAVDGGAVGPALARALDEANDDDMVLVTGSLYAVGNARAALDWALAEPRRRQ